MLHETPGAAGPAANSEFCWKTFKLYGVIGENCVTAAPIMVMCKIGTRRATSTAKVDAEPKIQRSAIIQTALCSRERAPSAGSRTTEILKIGIDLSGDQNPRKTK